MNQNSYLDNINYFLKKLTLNLNLMSVQKIVILWNQEAI